MARVKACAYGQTIATGKHKGKALTKVWRLMSTMNGLPIATSAPCPGNHEHVTTSGSWTLCSGKYPVGLADAFHRYFRTVACNSTQAYMGCCIHIPDTTARTVVITRVMAAVLNTSGVHGIDDGNGNDRSRARVQSPKASDCSPLSRSRTSDAQMYDDRGGHEGQDRGD